MYILEAVDDQFDSDVDSRKLGRLSTKYKVPISSQRNDVRYGINTSHPDMFTTSTAIASATCAGV